MPHVRRQQGKPGLDILSILIPGEKTPRCERMPDVVDARAFCSGRGANPDSSGDLEKCRTDHCVMEPLPSLVHEEWPVFPILPDKG